MSTESNTDLLERAQTLIQENEGKSWIDRGLIRAMDVGDLETLAYLVPKLEAETAIEHFYSIGVLSREDVF